MNHEIELTGCTPTPLAAYLKSLAVLRLLSEQKPEWNVQGFWKNGRFMIRSSNFTGDLTKDRQMIINFFLEEYQPTPVLSPWNGRAGYLEGEDGEDSTREGADLLKKFRILKGDRFSRYRKTIEFFDNILILKKLNTIRTKRKELEKSKKTSFKRQLDEEKKNEKILKTGVYKELRCSLEDSLLDWMDAVVTLGDGESRAFSPLLGGSGGAELSMELGVNFMDNLLHIFSLDNSVNQEAVPWIFSSLFDAPSLINISNKSGSLFPERIGGVNAGAGFNVGLGINPWDYLLMIEGTIAFHPALTKRLESESKASLSFPFSLDPIGAGSGNLTWVDEQKTRAGRSEIWMPLWKQPCSYRELKHFICEGNVTIGRKRVRNGLDFARAINQYGIDRGIHAFNRYQFLKRSGRNEIAVSLSSFQVSHDKVVSDFISDLDRKGWLERFRKFGRDKNAAHFISALTGQLDNALFDLTLQKNDSKAVQQALIILGKIQTALSKSAKVKDEKTGILPVPRLSHQWMTASNDGSFEFRIASALAGLKGEKDKRGEKDKPMPLACHLWRVHPLTLDVHPLTLEWKEKSCKDRDNDRACSLKFNVPQARDLCTWLSNILERRLWLSNRLEFKDKPLNASSGCDLDALEAFLLCRTDDTRIMELMTGLSLVDTWRDTLEKPEIQKSTISIIPAAFAALKFVFMTDSILSWLKVLPEGKTGSIPSGLIHLLAADRVSEAVELAERRLRISGIHFSVSKISLPGISGARIAAALLIPISASAAGTLVKHFILEEKE